MTSREWTSTETDIARALPEGALLDISDRADEAKKVRADVIRDLLLGRSLTGGSKPDPRGIRLRGATLVGRLDLDYLETDIGLQLIDCDISDGISANYGRLAHLSLTGSIIGHPAANESALKGVGLTVAGPLTLMRVNACSQDADATIDLMEAHIDNRLNLRGAALTNKHGPALRMDRISVGSYVFLDESKATGYGDRGAIDMRGGKIGGQLLLRSATLTSEAGPALYADRITVESAMKLDGCTATGDGQEGAVRLPAARVGGQLTFQGATLANRSGPALLADNIAVDGDALLTDGFTATGHGHDCVVRLRSAGFKRTLFIDVDRITSLSDESHRLVVEGMTYGDIVVASDTSWLSVLATGTPYYSPQPYRQLAAKATDAGHDGDARRVLMAQRRDQLDRADLNLLDFLWGQFTGFTLGYGYQPWRALVALVAVAVATAWLMTSSIGASGLYVKDQPDQPCSTNDRIVLGIDTALPLISTPFGATCVPRNDPSGQIITGASITAQTLGWAFATLFAVGFTGAVRKT